MVALGSPAAAPSLDPRTASAPLRPQATASGAAPSQPSSADRARPGLLWTGDLETGDLSQFQDGPWNDVGGVRPKVVTSPVRDGKYAVALGITGATTSADGICCGSRDELLPRFPDLHEGDDLWFGFSTYLAPGFVLYPEWQLITQFKQNFDGAPPLALYVEDGQYKVEGGYGYPAGPLPVLAADRLGQDWRMGRLDLAREVLVQLLSWLRGGLEGRSARPAPLRAASGTLYPGVGDRSGSYVKTGPYRDPTVTTPSTMYLDNWRIGTTRAAVAR